MKVYKVPVYKVIYDYCVKFGSLQELDTIFVKKKIIGVSEVLTGFNDIDVINKGYLKDGVLDFYSRKVAKAETMGYHLVVFAEDLVQKNLVRPEELDVYFDQYEESNWKKIYENMKILSKDEKKELKRKMNAIYEKKK